MKTVNRFPSLARQISVACLISMLYVLIRLLNGTPPLTFPLCLILYSAAVYLVNLGFSKRSRTIMQLFVVNAAFGAAVIALLFLSADSLPFWQAAYGVISVILVTVLGAAAVFHPVKLNSVILSLDANMLLLIFSTLILTPLSHPFTWVLFSVAGGIAGLLGAVSFRLGRAFGKREWGILLFLFALIALFAWLLFAFVVSPLSTGVVDLGRGIAAFFVFLGEQITRFFRFLASLWHDDGSSTAPDLQPASAFSAEDTAGSAKDNGIMPVLICVLIIAAVIILVILLLKKTGKRKAVLEKTTALQEELDHTGRMSLRAALLKIFARLKRKITARRFLAAHKNGPEGLYYRLKKKCRRTVLAAKSGDTPAEFLNRIKDCFEAEDDRLHFDELAGQLNRNFYSAHPSDTVYPWAADLLKKTGKAASAAKKSS